jgi:hypothetical protein
MIASFKYFTTNHLPFKLTSDSYETNTGKTVEYNKNYYLLFVTQCNFDPTMGSSSGKEQELEK